MTVAAFSVKRLRMPKRLEALSPNKFAAFCIAVLKESERRGDVIDDDELYDLALGVADENSLLAELAAGTYRDFGFHA